MSCGDLWGPTFLIASSRDGPPIFFQPAPRVLAAYKIPFWVYNAARWSPKLVNDCNVRSGVRSTERQRRAR
jgi:hypothetical protein